MYFNYVIIDNFKIYDKKISIPFHKGMNLIVAPNGSGKSTILSAIRLLLIDKHSSSNLNSLVNWNSTDKRFYIEIEFYFEGNTYKTHFDYDENRSVKSERVVYKNNDTNPVSVGAENVKKYFSELFDLVLLDNALFARQRENNIIDVTDRERSDILKKIKNIDFTKEVKADIEPKLEKSNTKLTLLTGEKTSLDAREYTILTIDEPPNSIDEIKNIKETRDKTNKELTDNKVFKAQYEKDESTLASFEKEKIEIEDSIQLKKKGKDTKQYSINEIEIKIYDGSAISSKEKTIKDYPNEESLKKAIENKYECDLEILSKKKVQLEKDLSEIQIGRLPVFSTNARDTCINELANLNALWTTTNKSLDNIKLGKCPECGSTFNTDNKAEYEKKLEDLNKEIEQIKLKIVEEDTKKTEYDTLITNRTKLVENKNKLQSELDIATTKIEGINTSIIEETSSISVTRDKTIQGLTESLSVLQDSLEKEKLSDIEKRASLQDGIASIVTDIDSLKTKLDTVSNTITALGDIKNKIEAVDTIISAKEKVLKTLDENILAYDTAITASLERDKANKETEKNKIKDELRLQEIEKEKIELNNYILELKEAKSILLKDLPSYIISQTIDDLTYDLNQFIEDVYTKSLNLEFKMNKSSTGLVYGGKKKVPVKGSLSGAESKLVQLGFISSFNKKLNLNCLFFDEPDEGVDETNSEQLYEIIADVSNTFEQFFVITHQKSMQEKLENYCDSHKVLI